MSHGKVKKQEEYYKVKQIYEDAKKMKLDKDLKNHDPYVLNDRLEDEWQFNEVRMSLLDSLAHQDKKENDLNQNHREIINI